MIGEGTHSTNQRRHNYVQENVEVGFFTDPTVCIGYKACEVACKEWNEVRMMASPGREIPTTPGISAQSYSEKWNYIRDNPVRAGLVSAADDWPYAGEIETLML
jgi:hypothetical protein